MDEALQQRINQFAGDMILVEPDAPAHDWEELSLTAAEISEGLMLDEAYTASEAFMRIGELFDTLARGDSDPAALLDRIQGLLTSVQESIAAGDPDSASLREAVARAGLVLRDLEATAQPVDASPDVDEEFLNEIGQRIDALEAMLYSLSAPVTDPEQVRAVFREYHTLKGEAGIVGLSELSAYCHDVESSMEAARYGEMILSAEMVDLLAQLTLIARMILWGQSGEQRDPAHVAELKTRFAELAANAGSETDASPPDASPAEEEELLFPGEEPQSDNERGTPGDEDLVPSSAAPARTSDERPVDDEEFQTVSVDVRTLDRLLEHVGEVSLLGTTLTQRHDILELPDAGTQLQELGRTCRSLQSLTADLRMAPVRPLFQRMQRAAHEAARSRHKHIEVRLEGTDTRVDRSLLSRLASAMVHLARNAADHGIESPQQRLAAGKPERGRIEIIARRSEANVEIEFSDDGAGLDLQRIRAKAESLGLVSPDAKLSDRETADLIFSSGLSTAGSVSDISGRGVGMNIVRDSVRALRGHVMVETEPGHGTRFVLRVPAALSAIEGFVVRVGESRLILPVTSVRESFRVRPDQVGSIEGRGEIVTLRGVVVPVIRVAEELGLRGDCERIEDGVLILVENGEHVCGVLVDEVLETRQVVIRPLEGELSDISAVSGAVLMPDRGVALVLETQALIASASVASSEAMRQAGNRQAASERTIETVSIGTNQVGMIDFIVRSGGSTGSDHAFAINAFKVREFVPAEGNWTDLPNAPQGFCGMLMLRNRTLPVVSLCELLGLGGSDAKDDPDASRIVIVCEFAGQVVGFLAHSVNRVSYISWNEILPPPESGGLYQMQYVVGTILHEALHGTGSAADEDDVIFVLDFERIVQRVMRLYGDVKLEGVRQRKGASRVLLAEDSTLIRRQMKASLEEAGLEVIEAGDGKTAMEAIQALHEKAIQNGESIFAHLDLILSDIEMPRMDGYTLTTFVKEHPELRVLPVILHSSITNETMITRAREVHADGFVGKCDHEGLVEQLRKHL